MYVRVKKDPTFPRRTSGAPPGIPEQPGMCFRCQKWYLRRFWDIWRFLFDLICLKSIPKNPNTSFFDALAGGGTQIINLFSIVTTSSDWILPPNRTEMLWNCLYQRLMSSIDIQSAHEQFEDRMRSLNNSCRIGQISLFKSMDFSAFFPKTTLI